MVDAPLLTMTDVVKDFPGVRALDGIELDVVAGEVHCLLGQNGAGKSTLIKVLAGVHRPDAGQITWQGSPVTIPHPTVAMDLGIATIYQELDVVEGLTVQPVDVSVGYRAGAIARAEPRPERARRERDPGVDHHLLGRRHRRQRRPVPPARVLVIVVPHRRAVTPAVRTTHEAWGT